MPEMNPVPKPERRPDRNRRRINRAQKRRDHYGGASNYQALKLQVFQRDRWVCLFCGADHLKRAISLELAHLKTVGMGGRATGTPDSLDHPMWGATSCRTCHEKIDRQGGGAAMKRAAMRALAQRYGYSYPESVLTGWREDSHIGPGDSPGAYSPGNHHSML